MRTVSGLLFGASMFLTGVAYQRWDYGEDALSALVFAVVLMAASILILWREERS